MSWTDEPDFEVTDLRTGQPDERVYAQGNERRQRRRRLGAGVLVLVLLVALVLPFLSVPGFGATVRQALHLPTPAPSPSLALGGDIIYFEHGLPWGTLLLDGKVVTNVETEQPYTGFEQLYTSLHIPSGRHLLTYTATPFPTLRCWVSTPAATSDTCPLIRSRGPSDVTPPFPAERVLDLGGDPATLSPSLRASLESAAARIVATLVSTATVAAGEEVVGDDGMPRVASSRMTATLTYTVAPGSGSRYIIPGSGLACVVLCAIQPASYVNDAHSQWVVAAHVLPTWTYTPAGEATFQGKAVAIGGVQPDGIVPLNVSWNGAWQVKVADSLATSPICFIPLNLFATLQLGSAPLSTIKTVPAPVPADGCLAVGDALDATGVPRIPFAVMYRFGVLYTVDDEARRLLPTLPVADVRLRSLAHAWQS